MEDRNKKGMNETNKFGQESHKAGKSAGQHEAHEGHKGAQASKTSHEEKGNHAGKSAHESSREENE